MLVQKRSTFAQSVTSLPSAASATRLRCLPPKAQAGWLTAGSSAPGITSWCECVWSGGRGCCEGSFWRPRPCWRAPSPPQSPQTGWAHSDSTAGRPSGGCSTRQLAGTLGEATLTCFPCTAWGPSCLRSFRLLCSLSDLSFFTTPDSYETYPQDWQSLPRNGQVTKQKEKQNPKNVVKRSCRGTRPVAECDSAFLPVFPSWSWESQTCPEGGLR